jgi:pumilio RNA-binding family
VYDCEFCRMQAHHSNTMYRPDGLPHGYVADPYGAPNPLMVNAMRSAPMSANDLANVPIEQLFGLISDRRGCQYLRNLFVKTPAIQMVLLQFALRENFLRDISMDAQGNFLAQDILDVAKVSHVEDIFRVLHHYWWQLSQNRYGCRVVQKVVECFPVNKVYELLSIFRGREVMAAKDGSACHVIQRIILTHGPEMFTYFAEVYKVLENFKSVIMNKYGCHVIQQLMCRLIHFCSIRPEVPSASHLREIFNEMLHMVLAYSKDLAENEYANYVIQYLVSVKEVPAIRQDVIRSCVIGNVLVLAQSKYGSHVVEKALSGAGTQELAEIATEIFDGYERNAENQDAIDILLFDQYGNYVCQTLIKIFAEVRSGRRQGDVQWFDRLAGRIHGHRLRLMKYSSGKKILELVTENRQY